jgi:transcriptional regulator with GAF, ATPase, and Fis domain
VLTHKTVGREPFQFGALHGVSTRMRDVFALLERVAPRDVSVLLEGETGTGKELCAEAIHEHSERRKGPFVICDLSGLSRSVIESELFGHVRGAFTGAERDRSGAFLQAHGGTIFIDEIGELELALQPRLLRVLEQRRIKPVGTSSFRDVDVRIIAATNRDLREEVRRRRFREDLYHRLAVVRVELPPLRGRPDDVLYLARHFLGARDYELTDDTLAALTAHDWPGNVRELRNAVERAVSLSSSRTLEPWLFGLDESPRSSPDAAPSSAAGITFTEAKDRLIAEWERDYVQQLLADSGGNVALAARQGGLDRVYLHRLIKKHRIGN